MSEPSQPTPEDKQEKSNRIKRRLIWLGIILGILGAIDVGYLIKNVISPSFF